MVKSHLTKRFVLLSLLCAMLILVCASCDKSTSGKEQTEFEVDKVYENGPLVVHVRLDKSKLTIAETLLLEFEAVIEGGYELDMPMVNKVLQDFGIVDWDDIGDRLDEQNNIVKKYQYRLEPFLSGNYAIPEFTFTFHDVNSVEEKKHELTTESIDVEVTSLLGQQREELIIADIEDVVEIPKEISLLWVWVFAGVIIIAGIFGFLLLRRKSVSRLVRVFKPAHEIAYDRLRALVKEDLVKAGKVKEFHERISDILRHYIEHRFELRAPERTTEEFLVELKFADCLSNGDKETIGEFLMHCDLVKFARMNPTTGQIQQTFDLVKNFIEKTKSDERQIDVTDRTELETVEAGSI